jgi:hypothetical protein
MILLDASSQRWSNALEEELREPRAFIVEVSWSRAASGTGAAAQDFDLPHQEFAL